MKTKLYVMLTLVASAFVLSCSSDDDSGPNTLVYQVTIEYPDTYDGALAGDVDVKLTNLTTNENVTAKTNATGIATFAVVPGNYSITASKELSEDEAEALTGVSGEVFLNATLSQVAILAEGGETLQLEGSPIGNWVIKEFYYAGTPPYYFYDSFIEIYNNSTDILFADGLLFGTTSGSSTKNPYGFVAEGQQDVYLAYMMQIPGSGNQYPVEPGKSIVIAVDGINHKDDPNGNPDSPVNLGPGIADFEVYFDVNPTTPDTDNPDVENVNILYSISTTAFDYLPGTTGSGLIIFRHDTPANLDKVTEPNSTSTRLYVKVPKENVIDGLDAVANETVTPDLKRLPTNIDAGMNTVGDRYTGTSLRRKVKKEIGDRKVLMDTNNSSNDFEVNEMPNPKGW